MSTFNLFNTYLRQTADVLASACVILSTMFFSVLIFFIFLIATYISVFFLILLDCLRGTLTTLSGRRISTSWATICGSWDTILNLMPHYRD